MTLITITTASVEDELVRALVLSERESKTFQESQRECCWSSV